MYPESQSLPLEKRDYGLALNEAEAAVKYDSDNQEARALRDQIQRLLIVLSK